MKIKTSELTGAALDWAVAKCEKRTLRHKPMGPQEGHGWWIWEETPSGRGGVIIGKSVYLSVGGEYSPSTKWSQGGPIIERERTGLVEPFSFWGNDGLVMPPAGADWKAYKFHPEKGYLEGLGHPPLIAAMRCYVASKLGDEVEIPEELSNA